MGVKGAPAKKMGALVGLVRPLVGLMAAVVEDIWAFLRVMMGHHCIGGASGGGECW